MNIDTIIFDLDDTLYPSSSGIWALIRARIDKFMIEKLNYAEHEVPTTREKFFKEFGTTLRGLESVHHIDPVEYLKFVHEIPLNKHLFPNTQLQEILHKIPLKKVIFTNGDRWHSKRVTDRLNISHFFEETVDILDVSPYCKPMDEAFNLAFQKLGITNPNNALLIDDNIRNIQAAKRLGLNTILVSENGHNGDQDLIKIRRIEDLESVFQILDISE